MMHREQRTGLEGRRLFDDDAVREQWTILEGRKLFDDDAAPGSSLSHTSGSNGTMPDNFTLTSP